MSNPTELPDLDRIANDLESEAIPYEGDFADAVRAAIEDIREVAAARRAQPEGEAPQAEPSKESIQRLAELHFYEGEAASMDIRVHRFARALLAHVKPAAQHAESGALPITRSTYGSLEACEAERERRAALAAQSQGAQQAAAPAGDANG